jgi:hypothetical protein
MALHHAHAETDTDTACIDTDADFGHMQTLDTPSDHGPASCACTDTDPHTYIPYIMRMPSSSSVFTQRHRNRHRPPGTGRHRLRHTT